MHRLGAALRCDLLAAVSNLEARGVLNFPLRPFFSPSFFPSSPRRAPRGDTFVKTIEREEPSYSLVSDV